MEQAALHSVVKDAEAAPRGFVGLEGLEESVLDAIDGDGTVVCFGELQARIFLV
jgi:hypothetical protein